MAKPDPAPPETPGISLSRNDEMNEVNPSGCEDPAGYVR